VHNPKFITGRQTKTEKAENVSKSVLNIYQLLHVMFEVAVEHDLIDNNPVKKNSIVPGTYTRRCQSGAQKTFRRSFWMFQCAGGRSSGVSR
jgi:hypothetical protein